MEGRRQIGLDLVQEPTMKIKVTRERVQVAQSKQKNYADNRRRDMEFQVRDHVFMKFPLTEENMRFVKRGKLSQYSLDLLKF